MWRLPHFLDGGEVAALGAGCLLPVEKFLVFICIIRRVDSKADESITSIEKPSVLFVNRTRDLPARSS
jgi:hypothetical protein